MASAVSYLHSNELIYCDLKTDNALVFSLDLNDPINIKLTDYGISRQLIGPGGFGDAGPPGFCAPEILKHDIFDNKVGKLTLLFLNCVIQSLSLSRLQRFYFQTSILRRK